MRRAAIINDLSGIGRCSLNVAISILTNLQVQVCPLPTAILSNQTGFNSFSFLDFTPYMKEYYKHWEEIGYEFDVIYSGFLGSKEQIKGLLEFMELFKRKATLVLIDPVMGDNGVLYPIYPTDYPDYMKKVIAYADVITPNATEFALLTGYSVLEEGVNKRKIRAHARQLSEIGPKRIVVTGIVDKEDSNHLLNLGMDFEKEEYFEERVAYNHQTYSGTGDIFASILCGYLTQGYSLEESVKVATHFISKAISYTEQQGIDPREGIMYEMFLRELNIR